MSVSKVNPIPLPISGPCAVCKKVTTLTCGRCQLVFYCNQNCQKKVWKEHKLVCLTPEARQERTNTILEENGQLTESKEFHEALQALGLAPQLSEQRQREMEIRQLIEASPDRGILLQLIDKVFPQDICEIKLEQAWEKLTPGARKNRHQKYQEILQKFQKLQEQKPMENSVIMPIQIIREAAKAVLNMPAYPSSNFNVASIRAAAKTVLETLPMIEASPDCETITTYCSRAVACAVLEADLKLRWMKLSRQEAASRKAAWQKIAPQYDPFIKAVMLMQNQAFNYFVSKT
jgi:hypothetical protein